MKKLNKKQIWKLQCEAIDTGKDFIKTPEEWKDFIIKKAKVNGTYLSSIYKNIEKSEIKKKKKPYWKKQKLILSRSHSNTLVEFNKIMNKINYYDRLCEDLIKPVNFNS